MRIPGSGRVRRVASAISASVRRRSPRGVILLYHRVAGPRFDPLMLDVSPANFAAQLAVLRTDATVLPLGEFESLRAAGSLPPRAVAVTFDDGYADNLTMAAPLLATAAMPATIFVASGAVGSVREFWWDDVERIVCAAGPLAGSPPVPVQWPGEDQDGAPRAPWTIETRRPGSARQELYHALIAHLRPLDGGARAHALASLRAWASIPDGARASHRTVSEGECRALAESPGITIGAHSVSHPVLALLGAAEQQRELSESRVRLESITGTTVDLVAYPYGTRSDVNEASARAATAAGFRAAFANEAACAWRRSDRWRVPRILVRDWDEAEFRRRLAAWWLQ